MTFEQIEDLFIEWDLYGDIEKEEMINQYREMAKGFYNREDFLAFLRDKMEIVGYWQKVGLA